MHTEKQFLEVIGKIIYRRVCGELSEFEACRQLEVIKNEYIVARNLRRLDSSK